MPVPRRSLQGEWSSHGLFILALAGASIGFGNLWRFPALVSVHGGGAFILLYLLCLLLLAVPLLLAEIMVGRAAHQSPVQAFGNISRLHGGPAQWGLAGGLALLGAVLLLSTLSVVAGWAIGYLLRIFGGAVDRLDIIDATALFHALSSDPERSLAWQTLFMALIMAVVMRGLKNGIEPFIKVAVPMLLLGISVLMILALWQQESGTAVQQVFRLDFVSLDADAVRAALRQGFYSLALGVGVASTYGAYLPDRRPFVASTLAVVAVDTLFAVVAAVIVLTLLAAGGFSLHSGSGLIFETLPMVMSELPGGNYIAVMLFTVLVLAAVTTGVALMESVVAWLVERGGVRRPSATLLAGTVIWVLGIGGVFSFTDNSWYPLSLVPGLETATVYDLINRFATLIVLPLAALAAVVFVGWAVPPESVLYGLGWRDSRLFRLCYLVIRFVAPLLLLFVFVDGLGLMRGNNG